MLNRSSSSSAPPSAPPLNGTSYIFEATLAGHFIPKASSSRTANRFKLALWVSVCRSRSHDRLDGKMQEETRSALTFCSGCIAKPPNHKQNKI